MSRLLHAAIDKNQPLFEAIDMSNSRKNFGHGRKLAYAFAQAIGRFYGPGQHFGTQRAHRRRILVFATFCNRQGISDAREISMTTVADYAAYLKLRLVAKLGEKSISTAYAHNLLSTVNVVMYAMRRDNRVWISPRKSLHAARHYVRKELPDADHSTVKTASVEMENRGDARGAAATLLMRTWGMRAQESALQNLPRMLREIKTHGRAWVLDGCKGGRRDQRRWLEATPERLAALSYAISVKPEDSDCLLAKDENVRIFYSTVFGRCRRILKKYGIHDFKTLRAACAVEEYESIAGIKPMGMIKVSRYLDRKARLHVAHILGHAREQISSCYVGGY